MISLIALLALCVTAAEAAPSLPSLDELAANRMACDTLEIMPAIANFHGSMSAGRNVLSIESLTLPPVSQGGEALRLLIDGQEVPAQWSQWRAYEISRGVTCKGVAIQTQARMVFEDSGVLFRVELKNESTVPQDLKVSVASLPFLRRFDKTWEWSTPRPEPKAEAFAVEAPGPDVLTSADKESPCASAVAFLQTPDQIDAATSTVGWSVALQPNESRTFEFVLALHDSAEHARERAAKWAGAFEEQFEAAKSLWQARFDAAFTPNNGHFSGYLPRLRTSTPWQARLYYGSALSWLCMERTNFTTGFPRVFVTCSPHFAPSLTYFWDTISYASMWCLLDPEQVKAQLLLFLSADIDTCYAIDFLSLKGVGPWYSANDYAVFNLLVTYMRTTGSAAILDERLPNGQIVFDAVESIAMHWKTLVKTPGGLADYGTKDNLLETVPTYTNQVASFNAANVWMMRELAILYAHRDKQRTAQLWQEANALAEQVIGIYKRENGWWYAVMPDGRNVEVRSIVDFITTVECLGNDIRGFMRKQMIPNVENELWANGWVRALSREDASAKATLASPEAMATLETGNWPGNSLRADHGFTGSYSAWPALTIECFYKLDQCDRAKEMLEEVVPVLDEGPFGQSYYVATDKRPIRKAWKGGQDYFEGCGGAFADVILRLSLSRDRNQRSEIYFLNPSGPPVPVKK